MVDVTIGGTVYAVPPLGFKRLRKAAPHIDRVVEILSGGLGNVEATDAAFEVMCIVAIALGDPQVTAESLEDAASTPEALALAATYEAIMVESGLKKPGEPRAAVEPGPVA